jgi:hypothetical protein
MRLSIYQICVILFLQIVSLQLFAQELHTTSKKAIRYYEDSKEFFKDGNLQKSAELLIKALEIDPNFVEAHFALGNAYKLLSKDSPEASEKYEYHYRKCLEISPKDRKLAPIYFEVAQLDFQKGDYKGATPKMQYFPHPYSCK